MDSDRFGVGRQLRIDLALWNRPSTPGGPSRDAVPERYGTISMAATNT